ncbi:MAG: hypothetical protein U0175_14995 [Caldilineaceae bacterium]
MAYTNNGLSNQGLYSVWGTGTSNIWAVGVSGAILKWEGTGWQAQK